MDEIVDYEELFLTDSVEDEDCDQDYYEIEFQEAMDYLTTLGIPLLDGSCEILSLTDRIKLLNKK